jgi:hypothetical protein
VDAGELRTFAVNLIIYSRPFAVKSFICSTPGFRPIGLASEATLHGCQPPYPSNFFVNVMSAFSTRETGQPALA